ncbi:MAG: IclR family transcriptional regulator [Pigmentiphaga sp.]
MNGEISTQAANGSARVGGVAALERGLNVLLAFRNSDGDLSLAELAERTGMYKSTILRLCESLERLDFLRRPEKGRYQLGPAVYELGVIYSRSFRLEPYVMPVLRELVLTSGESASFYVRDGQYRVCLHRVDSARAVRDAHVRVGDRFPLTGKSATTLLLRAFSGEPGEELDRVRTDRYAASFGVNNPDTAAAACPVFGVAKQFLGVLSISGPRVRFTDEAVVGMRERLAAATAALSRTLSTSRGPNPGANT